jgi:hypothetical protein
MLLAVDPNYEILVLNPLVFLGAGKWPYIAISGAG